VVAALANAGFLAVALTTAASLVSPDRKGRALAVLLSGTTVATIAGVPGGAALGTLLGWRATFWAVAALCLPAAVGILKGIPARPGQEDAVDGAAVRAVRAQPAGPTLRAERAQPARPALPAMRTEPAGPALRAELAQLTRPRLLLVMLVGALVNAATFAGFTFLAPIVTGAAGLGELWIPVVLMLFGAGSLVGVTVAGRLSDQRPGLVLTAAGPLLLLGWPALAVGAEEPVALLVLVFFQGALSFALGSTLITRVLYEAAGAPTMAGSYATAALNVGAAVGPLIAATTLGTSVGTLGPLWASALLVALALLISLPCRGVIAAGRSTEVVE
jgi:DHA1 family chloramphenicol resistance protein-like MFS transporter